MRKTLKLGRGFTLIELLVVILILAILAALIVPRVIGRSGEAKQAAARADISTLRGLLQAFRLDTGRYPSTEEGLEALRVQPSDVNGWKGPYTERAIPMDPWGNPYVYEFPGPEGEDSILLMSYGQDNAQGGTGEATDIGEGENTGQ